MSGDIRLSVGTRVYAAVGAPTTYDAAGFSAKVYTEVGEVTSLGEFGGQAQITQHVPIATGIVSKRKGSIDYGQMQLQIGRLAGDAGQALLKAGFDGGNAYVPHSFKIVSVDGDVLYFTGLVGQFTTVFNDANAVTGVTCNIELDNKVLSDVYGYSLQYNAGANGMVIGAVFQSVASGGDGTPVYAHANAGYKFDKWSDNSSANPRTDTAVSANVTVTAQFVVD